MTAFSAVIPTWANTAASASGLTGVYHQHVYSDRVKWDLRDRVLSSDEITVFMCAGFQTEWLRDRACKFPQVSPLSLTLSPSLPDVMVGIAVAGSPQQHESCKKKKKCARSQRNNTVTLVAAAIITLLPLTAGTHTVQPGVYQSLNNTQPHDILVLNSPLFSRTEQKFRLLSMLILPTYNLACAIGWAGIYLTKQCVY